MSEDDKPQEAKKDYGTPPKRFHLVGPCIQRLRDYNNMLEDINRKGRSSGLIVGPSPRQRRR